MDELRVVLLDVYALLRIGFQVILGTQPNAVKRVVAEASRGTRTIALVVEHAP